ncbi:MAG: sulfur carrier protein ThiS [Nitrospirae bacterium]|nr:sulfur carrier protein ThiS [Nitrospirota bacterium]
MKIKVNGEAYETEQHTLSGLLEEMKVRSERVAVEVNLKVIKRADVADYRINEGDVIEVVNFVGGGDGR